MPGSREGSLLPRGGGGREGAGGAQRREEGVTSYGIRVNTVRTALARRLGVRNVPLSQGWEVLLPRVGGGWEGEGGAQRRGEGSPPLG